LTATAVAARAAKLGLWAEDRSHSSLRGIDQAGLEQDGVVFPKAVSQTERVPRSTVPDISGFLPWVAEKREQVLDLPTSSFTHFDNVLTVEGDECAS
jgi:hypothetical protein